MESHIKAVGLLHVILGSLGILGGLVAMVVFGALAGVVQFSDNSHNSAVAVPVLGAIGTMIFLVVLLISVPGLIGGIGLMRMAPWSRVFMIVISALDLLSVPLGTAVGIYGLWVLTKPETEALMARKSHAAAAY
jgi:hypothetical protein